MKKLTSLLCFVLIPVLLVSCTPKGHTRVDQNVLFDHLKPYIGVSSVDTLEAVMVDIYYRYRETALEYDSLFARDMMLHLNPYFSSETLSLNDEGLIGKIVYYRSTRVVGKVGVTDYYNITYNFFTGDIYSNIDWNPRKRLSYTKFYVEPISQLDYVTKINDYYS